MKRRKISIEIIAAAFLLIISAVMGYYFYLQPVVMQFLSIHTAIKNNTVLLEKKQNQAIHEKSVDASLMQWHAKHPRFYQTVQSTQTLNQLLQPLTVVIKQTHFVVTNIKLVSSHQKKSRDCIVQLKISGAFQDLFSLIAAVNHFPYPIVINQLTINQDHVFDLELGIRGMCD